MVVLEYFGQKLFVDLVLVPRPLVIIATLRATPLSIPFHPFYFPISKETAEYQMKLLCRGRKGDRVIFPICGNFKAKFEGAWLIIAQWWACQE